jgi:Mn-containing catalase
MKMVLEKKVRQNVNVLKDPLTEIMTEVIADHVEMIAGQGEMIEDHAEMIGEAEETVEAVIEGRGGKNSK